MAPTSSWFCILSVSRCLVCCSMSWFKWSLFCNNWSCFWPSWAKAYLISAISESRCLTVSSNLFALFVASRFNPKTFCWFFECKAIWSLVLALIFLSSEISPSRCKIVFLLSFKVYSANLMLSFLLKISNLRFSYSLFIAICTFSNLPIS